MGPCSWYEERVCIKKGEGVPIIKRREGRGTQIYFGTTEERVY